MNFLSNMIVAATKPVSWIGHVVTLGNEEWISSAVLVARAAPDFFGGRTFTSTIARLDSHGNQPDHGFPYLYYWVGKQEKSQEIIDTIMDRFYGMDGGLTLCGMDDAGEMSSWYVFNAIGIYPYSPADEDYIVCVPIFDEIRMRLSNGTVKITKNNSGQKIVKIVCDKNRLNGYFVPHRQLVKAKKLIIETTSNHAIMGN